MKTALALILAGMMFVTVTAENSFAASKTNRITFNYKKPDDPKHQFIYNGLTERRVFEKIQEFLSPFKLPNKVEYVLEGCDGSEDVIYEDNTITFCYEFIDRLYKNMPKKVTPAGIAPIDTIIGPFFDTALHEFAHALFDMFYVPILGREEDAADQVAAYIYLQLGREEARRLIYGTAYNYLINSANADDAAETKEEFREDFAESHSTPEQRAFNLLCIAYGADQEFFAEIVTAGYLPKERAEVCQEEYEQLVDAYDELILPHVDEDMADDIFDRTWLRKASDFKKVPAAK
ncbi:MAG: hypothetical protein JKY82_04660 [Rhizobiaceae bacterium]|nr:hypothetical protein [Rhizobiaceae bacterium]